MEQNAQTEYTLIIVGAGPAGSAAAFTAASLGIHTCVIDKRAFPRDKLCGGLVTGRSKKIFEIVFRRPWDQSLFLASDTIRFFSNNRFLADNVGYSTLYFTMRQDFDAYLLSLVNGDTVTVMLETEINQLDIRNGRLVLGNGNTLLFKYLIGADGVNSQVAKTLFGTSFNPSTIGFGLEVEVPRSDMNDPSDRVEIDFGTAKWGYGWTFPKKTSFTIGVGGIHRLNTDLRARLATFLSQRQLDIANYEVKGQYIPFGEFRSIPGVDNILLCGDAAGVVDPISGEGIAYAMQTGSAAARAVGECEKAKAGSMPALSFYQREYSAVATQLRQARAWRFLIFPAVIHKLFSWAFSDASTLQNAYLDILSGKRGYSALYGLFLLQAWKAIRKGTRYTSRRTLEFLRISR
jgi:geranylgeranyl reductase family protein